MVHAIERNDSMDFGYLGIIVIAAILSIVIRILDISLSENITRNSEYDEYVNANRNENRNLNEGPEAYHFKETDLIKDFRLNKDSLRKALMDKRYVAILILNLFVLFRITMVADNSGIFISTVLVAEALILLSIVDIEYAMIPDSIHAVIIVAAVINIIAGDPTTIRNRIIGMLVGGVFFGMLYLLGGMGGGDVKLMAAAGFWMGYSKIVLAMLIGIFIAAFVGVILIILKMKSRKDPIAFGPFLSAGIIIVVLFSYEIISFMR